MTRQRLVRAAGLFLALVYAQVHVIWAGQPSVSPFAVPSSSVRPQVPFEPTRSISEIFRFHFVPVIPDRFWHELRDAGRERPMPPRAGGEVRDAGEPLGNLDAVPNANLRDHLLAQVLTNPGAGLINVALAEVNLNGLNLNDGDRTRLAALQESGADVRVGFRRTAEGSVVLIFSRLMDGRLHNVGTVSLNWNAAESRAEAVCRLTEVAEVLAPARLNLHGIVNPRVAEIGPRFQQYLPRLGFSGNVADIDVRTLVVDGRFVERDGRTRFVGVITFQTRTGMSYRIEGGVDGNVTERKEATGRATVTETQHNLAGRAVARTTYQPGSVEVRVNGQLTHFEARNGAILREVLLPRRESSGDPMEEPGLNRDGMVALRGAIGDYVVREGSADATFRMVGGAVTLVQIRQVDGSELFSRNAVTGLMEQTGAIRGEHRFRVLGGPIFQPEDGNAQLRIITFLGEGQTRDVAAPVEPGRAPGGAPGARPGRPADRTEERLVSTGVDDPAHRDHNVEWTLMPDGSTRKAAGAGGGEAAAVMSLSGQAQQVLTRYRDRVSIFHQDADGNRVRVAQTFDHLTVNWQDAAGNAQPGRGTPWMYVSIPSTITGAPREALIERLGKMGISSETPFPVRNAREARGTMTVREGTGVIAARVDFVLENGRRANWTLTRGGPSLVNLQAGADAALGALRIRIPEGRSDVQVDQTGAFVQRQGSFAHLHGVEVENGLGTYRLSYDERSDRVGVEIVRVDAPRTRVFGTEVHLSAAPDAALFASGRIFHRLNAPTEARGPLRIGDQTVETRFSMRYISVDASGEKTVSAEVVVPGRIRAPDAPRPDRATGGGGRPSAGMETPGAVSRNLFLQTVDERTVIDPIDGEESVVAALITESPGRDGEAPTYHCQLNIFARGSENLVVGSAGLVLGGRRLGEGLSIDVTETGDFRVASGAAQRNIVNMKDGSVMTLAADTVAVFDQAMNLRDITAGVIDLRSADQETAQAAAQRLNPNLEVRVEQRRHVRIRPGAPLEVVTEGRTLWQNRAVGPVNVTLESGVEVRFAAGTRATSQEASIYALAGGAATVQEGTLSILGAQTIDPSILPRGMTAEIVNRGTTAITPTGRNVIPAQIRVRVNNDGRDLLALGADGSGMTATHDAEFTVSNLLAMSDLRITRGRVVTYGAQVGTRREVASGVHTEVLRQRSVRYESGRPVQTQQEELALTGQAGRTVQLTRTPGSEGVLNAEFDGTLTFTSAATLILTCRNDEGPNAMPRLNMNPEERAGTSVSITESATIGPRGGRSRMETVTTITATAGGSRISRATSVYDNEGRVVMQRTMNEGRRTSTNRRVADDVTISLSNETVARDATGRVRHRRHSEVTNADNPDTRRVVTTTEQFSATGGLWFRVQTTQVGNGDGDNFSGTARFFTNNARGRDNYQEVSVSSRNLRFVTQLMNRMQSNAGARFDMAIGDGRYQFQRGRLMLVGLTETASRRPDAPIQVLTPDLEGLEGVVTINDSGVTVRRSQKQDLFRDSEAGGRVFLVSTTILKGSDEEFGTLRQAGEIIDDTGRTIGFTRDRTGVKLDIPGEGGRFRLLGNDVVVTGWASSGNRRIVTELSRAQLGKEAIVITNSEMLRGTVAWVGAGTANLSAGAGATVNVNVGAGESGLLAVRRSESSGRESYFISSDQSQSTAGGSVTVEAGSVFQRAEGRLRMLSGTLVLAEGGSLDVGTVDDVRVLPNPPSADPVNVRAQRADLIRFRPGDDNRMIMTSGRLFVWSDNTRSYAGFRAGTVFMNTFISRYRGSLTTGNPDEWNRVRVLEPHRLLRPNDDGTTNEDSGPVRLFTSAVILDSPRSFRTDDLAIAVNDRIKHWVVPRDECNHERNYRLDERGNPVRDFDEYSFSVAIYTQDSGGLQRLGSWTSSWNRVTLEKLDNQTILRWGSFSAPEQEVGIRLEIDPETGRGSWVRDTTHEQYSISERDQPFTTVRTTYNLDGRAASRTTYDYYTNRLISRTDRQRDGSWSNPDIHSDYNPVVLWGFVREKSLVTVVAPIIAVLAAITAVALAAFTGGQSLWLLVLVGVLAAASGAYAGYSGTKLALDTGQFWLGMAIIATAFIPIPGAGGALGGVAARAALFAAIRAGSASLAMIAGLAIKAVVYSTLGFIWRLAVVAGQTFARIEAAKAISTAVSVVMEKGWTDPKAIGAIFTAVWKTILSEIGFIVMIPGVTSLLGIGQSTANAAIWIQAIVVIGIGAAVGAGSFAVAMLSQERGTWTERWEAAGGGYGLAWSIAKGIVVALAVWGVVKALNAMGAWWAARGSKNAEEAIKAWEGTRVLTGAMILRNAVAGSVGGVTYSIMSGRTSWEELGRAALQGLFLGILVGAMFNAMGHWGQAAQNMRAGEGGARLTFYEFTSLRFQSGLWMGLWEVTFGNVINPWIERSGMAEYLGLGGKKFDARERTRELRDQAIAARERGHTAQARELSKKISDIHQSLAYQPGELAQLFKFMGVVDLVTRVTGMSGETFMKEVDKFQQTTQNIAMLHPFFAFGGGLGTWNPLTAGPGQIASWLALAGETMVNHAVATMATAGVSTVLMVALQYAGYALLGIALLIEKAIVMPATFKSFELMERAAVVLAEKVGFIEIRRDAGGHMIMDAQGHYEVKGGAWAEFARDFFSFLGFLATPAAPSRSHGEQVAAERLSGSRNSFWDIFLTRAEIDARKADANTFAAELLASGNGYWHGKIGEHSYTFSEEGLRDLQKQAFSQLAHIGDGEMGRLLAGVKDFSDGVFLVFNAQTRTFRLLDAEKAGSESLGRTLEWQAAERADIAAARKRLGLGEGENAFFITGEQSSGAVTFALSNAGQEELRTLIENSTKGEGSTVSQAVGAQAAYFIAMHSLWHRGWLGTGEARAASQDFLAAAVYGEGVQRQVGLRERQVTVVDGHRYVRGSVAEMSEGARNRIIQSLGNRIRAGEILQLGLNGALEILLQGVETARALELTETAVRNGNKSDGAAMASAGTPLAQAQRMGELSEGNLDLAMAFSDNGGAFFRVRESGRKGSVLEFIAGRGDYIVRERRSGDESRLLKSQARHLSADDQAFISNRGSLFGRLLALFTGERSTAMFDRDGRLTDYENADGISLARDFRPHAEKSASGKPAALDRATVRRVAGAVGDLLTGPEGGAKRAARVLAELADGRGRSSRDAEARRESLRDEIVKEFQSFDGIKDAESKGKAVRELARSAETTDAEVQRFLEDLIGDVDGKACGTCMADYRDPALLTSLVTRARGRATPAADTGTQAQWAAGRLRAMADGGMNATQRAEFAQAARVAADRATNPVERQALVRLAETFESNRFVVMEVRGQRMGASEAAVVTARDGYNAAVRSYYLSSNIFTTVSAWFAMRSARSKYIEAATSEGIRALEGSLAQLQNARKTPLGASLAVFEEAIGVLSAQISELKEMISRGVVGSIEALRIVDQTAQMKLRMLGAFELAAQKGAEFRRETEALDPGPARTAMLKIVKLVESHVENYQSKDEVERKESLREIDAAFRELREAFSLATQTFDQAGHRVNERAVDSDAKIIRRFDAGRASQLDRVFEAKTMDDWDAAVSALFNRSDFNPAKMTVAERIALVLALNDRYFERMDSQRIAEGKAPKNQLRAAADLQFDGGKRAGLLVQFLLGRIGGLEAGAGKSPLFVLAFGEYVMRSRARAAEGESGMDFVVELAVFGGGEVKKYLTEYQSLALSLRLNPVDGSSFHKPESRAEAERAYDPANRSGWVNMIVHTLHSWGFFELALRSDPLSRLADLVTSKVGAVGMDEIDALLLSKMSFINSEGNLVADSRLVKRTESILTAICDALGIKDIESRDFGNGDQMRFVDGDPARGGRAGYREFAGEQVDSSRPGLWYTRDRSSGEIILSDALRAEVRKRLSEDEYSTFEIDQAFRALMDTSDSSVSVFRVDEQGKLRPTSVENGAPRDGMIDSSPTYNVARVRFQQIAWRVQNDKQASEISMDDVRLSESSAAATLIQAISRRGRAHRFGATGTPGALHGIAEATVGLIVREVYSSSFIDFREVVARNVREAFDGQLDPGVRGGMMTVSYLDVATAAGGRPATYESMAADAIAFSQGKRGIARDAGTLIGSPVESLLVKTFLQYLRNNGGGRLADALEFHTVNGTRERRTLGGILDTVQRARQELENLKEKGEIAEGSNVDVALERVRTITGAGEGIDAKAEEASSNKWVVFATEFGLRGLSFEATGVQRMDLVLMGMDASYKSSESLLQAYKRTDRNFVGDNGSVRIEIVDSRILGNRVDYARRVDAQAQRFGRTDGVFAGDNAMRDLLRRDPATLTLSQKVRLAAEFASRENLARSAQFFINEQVEAKLFKEPIAEWKAMMGAGSAGGRFLAELERRALEHSDKRVVEHGKEFRDPRLIAADAFRHNARNAIQFLGQVASNRSVNLEIRMDAARRLRDLAEALVDFDVRLFNDVAPNGLHTADRYRNASFANALNASDVADAVIALSDRLLPNTELSKKAPGIKGAPQFVSGVASMSTAAGNPANPAAAMPAGRRFLDAVDRPGSRTASTATEAGSAARPMTYYEQSLYMAHQALADMDDDERARALQSLAALGFIPASAASSTDNKELAIQLVAAWTQAGGQEHAFSMERLLEVAVDTVHLVGRSGASPAAGPSSSVPEDFIDLDVLRGMIVRTAQASDDTIGESNKEGPTERSVRMAETVLAVAGIDAGKQNAEEKAAKKGAAVETALRIVTLAAQYREDLIAQRYRVQGGNQILAFFRIVGFLAWVAYVKLWRSPEKALARLTKTTLADLGNAARADAVLPEVSGILVAMATLVSGVTGEGRETATDLIDRLARADNPEADAARRGATPAANAPKTHGLLGKFNVSDLVEMADDPMEKLMRQYGMAGGDGALRRLRERIASREKGVLFRDLKDLPEGVKSFANYFSQALRFLGLALPMILGWFVAPSLILPIVIGAAIAVFAAQIIAADKIDDNEKPAKMSFSDPSAMLKGMLGGQTGWMGLISGVAMLYFFQNPAPLLFWASVTLAGIARTGKMSLFSFEFSIRDVPIAGALLTWLWSLLPSEDPFTAPTLPARAIALLDQMRRDEAAEKEEAAATNSKAKVEGQTLKRLGALVDKAPEADRDELFRLALILSGLSEEASDAVLELRAEAATSTDASDDYDLLSSRTMRELAADDADIDFLLEVSRFERDHPEVITPADVDAQWGTDADDDSVKKARKHYAGREVDQAEWNKILGAHRRYESERADFEASPDGRTLDPAGAARRDGPRNLVAELAQAKDVFAISQLAFNDVFGGNVAKAADEVIGHRREMLQEMRSVLKQAGVADVDIDNLERSIRRETSFNPIVTAVGPAIHRAMNLIQSRAPAGRDDDVRAALDQVSRQLETAYFGELDLIAAGVRFGLDAGALRLVAKVAGITTRAAAEWDEIAPVAQAAMMVAPEMKGLSFVKKASGDWEIRRVKTDPTGAKTWQTAARVTLEDSGERVSVDIFHQGATSTVILERDPRTSALLRVAVRAAAGFTVRVDGANGERQLGVRGDLRPSEIRAGTRISLVGVAGADRTVTLQVPFVADRTDPVQEDLSETDHPLSKRFEGAPERVLPTAPNPTRTDALNALDDLFDPASSATGDELERQFRAARLFLENDESMGLLETRPSGQPWNLAVVRHAPPAKGGKPGAVAQIWLAVPQDGPSGPTVVLVGVVRQGNGQLTRTTRVVAETTTTAAFSGIGNVTYLSWDDGKLALVTPTEPAPAAPASAPASSAAPGAAPTAPASPASPAPRSPARSGAAAGTAATATAIAVIAAFLFFTPSAAAATPGAVAGPATGLSEGAILVGLLVIAAAVMIGFAIRYAFRSYGPAPDSPSGGPGGDRRDPDAPQDGSSSVPVVHRLDTPDGEREISLAPAALDLDPASLPDHEVMLIYPRDGDRYGAPRVLRQVLIVTSGALPSFGMEQTHQALAEINAIAGPLSADEDEPTVAAMKGLLNDDAAGPVLRNILVAPMLAEAGVARLGSRDDLIGRLAAKNLTLGDALAILRSEASVEAQSFETFLLRLVAHNAESMATEYGLLFSETTYARLVAEMGDIGIGHTHPRGHGAEEPSVQDRLMDQRIRAMRARRGLAAEGHVMFIHTPGASPTTTVYTYRGAALALDRAGRNVNRLLGIGTGASGSRGLIEAAPAPVSAPRASFLAAAGERLRLFFMRLWSGESAEIAARSRLFGDRAWVDQTTEAAVEFGLATRFDAEPEAARKWQAVADYAHGLITRGDVETLARDDAATALALGDLMARLARMNGRRMDATVIPIATFGASVRHFLRVSALPMDLGWVKAGARDALLLMDPAQAHARAESLRKRIARTGARAAAEKMQALLPAGAALDRAIDRAQDGLEIYLTAGERRAIAAALLAPSTWHELSANQKAVAVRVVARSLAGLFANDMGADPDRIFGGALNSLRPTVSAQAGANGEASLTYLGGDWVMEVTSDPARPAEEDFLAVLGQTAHELGHIVFRQLGVGRKTAAAGDLPETVFEEAWVHAASYWALIRILPEVALRLDLRMAEREMELADKKVLFLNYDQVRGDAELSKALSAARASDGKEEIVLIVTDPRLIADAMKLGRAAGAVVVTPAMIRSARPARNEAPLVAYARAYHNTSRVLLASRGPLSKDLAQLVSVNGTVVARLVQVLESRPLAGQVEVIFRKELGRRVTGSQA